MNRPLWLSIVIAVLGVALILAVVAFSAPATATARFSESGLPPGRPWSVTVANRTYTSSSDTVSVALLPADYAFDVTLANGTDFLPIPASGHMALSASGTTVSIAFVRSQANVTVTETGLPAASVWTVAEGSHYHHSNTTGMSIPEPDGMHSLRFLVALTGGASYWNQTNYWEYVDYAPNVSRIGVAVNGSDVQVNLLFSPLIRFNDSMYAINVFPNDTALGAPAYEFGALTFYRFAAVNFSFEGISLNGVVQNATAYLMTPGEFSAFTSTGNASGYVWTTGNVSTDTINMTFDSGTWYFVVTGWAVDAFRSVGLYWQFYFPGSLLYSS